MDLLKKIWEGWKGFGRFLGNLLARIVLSLFYFTVFVPFAVGVRLFSDPLHLKTGGTGYWQARTTGDQNLEEVARQF